MSGSASVFSAMAMVSKVQGPGIHVSQELGTQDSNVSALCRGKGKVGIAMYIGI